MLDVFNICPNHFHGNIFLAFKTFLEEQNVFMEICKTNELISCRKFLTVV